MNLGGAYILQKCRGCGCTNTRPCPGGCTWVEVDLCSACAELATMPRFPEHPLGIEGPETLIDDFDDDEGW